MKFEFEEEKIQSKIVQDNDEGFKKSESSEQKLFFGYLFSDPAQ